MADVKTTPKPKKTAAPKRAPKATPAKTARGKNTTTRKKAPASAPARAMPARRADYGAPIEGFFAKQPPHLRVILDTLRGVIQEAAPDATASLKWGMPNFAIGRSMMCALAGFKSHVNLIVAGPPDAFAAPRGLLEGDGKTGRHLKLRSLDELPHDEVRRWVRAAAKIARAKAS
jgi:hypothetical protein